MAEGSVIISPKDKSLKKLFIRFFPVHFLAIINKEIITHLISMLALKVNFSEIEFTDTYLKDLKRLTCKINGYNFISVLPVSPYSEIEEIYYRLKSNLNSRSSGDSIGSTLNEITTLVQEETERLKQEREKKIGYFIGALGLTGLISYFFDYVYISNNEKLIDGIIYPLNLVPILLLFILFFVFLFIFGVIKIRTDDWFVKRR
jgi:hypothetical protein